jgi:hypothetical protein
MNMISNTKDVLNFVDGMARSMLGFYGENLPDMKTVCKNLSMECDIHISILATYIYQSLFIFEKIYGDIHGMTKREILNEIYKNLNEKLNQD